MFIEWLGEVEYEGPIESNRFISNLKWDYIYVIIPINNICVGFFVKYYIKTPKDLIYIWEEIGDYVRKQWGEYINNNITSTLRYKCQHCLFNNQCKMYIEESKYTSNELECYECKTHIDNKFIRNYDNNCYHINCFNQNPNIFKNNKKILFQCKMCNKYINIMDHGLQHRNLFNRYNIFKYIINSELLETYTHLGNDKVYTLLFLTK